MLLKMRISLIFTRNKADLHIMWLEGNKMGADPANMAALLDWADHCHICENERCTIPLRYVLHVPHSMRCLVLSQRPFSVRQLSKGVFPSLA